MCECVWGRRERLEGCRGTLRFFIFEGLGGCLVWVMGEGVGENVSGEVEGR